MGGKVKHIRFDPNNLEHKLVLMKMRREWAENKGYKLQEKTLRNWINNKIDSQIRGEIVTYIQKVKNTYSGFITVKFLEREALERAKKVLENVPDVKRVLFVHEIFVRPEFRDTVVIEHPETGEILAKEKRKNQLFLAAKLLRFVAKRHGLPVVGGWLKDGGKQIYEKYGNTYDEGFFRIRGMKAQHRKRKLK